VVNALYSPDRSPDIVLQAPAITSDTNTSTEPTHSYRHAYLSTRVAFSPLPAL
jgi:hypothetical protein